MRALVGGIKVYLAARNALRAHPGILLGIRPVRLPLSTVLTAHWESSQQKAGKSFARRVLKANFRMSSVQ
jgi:hypothetical protein